MYCQHVAVSDDRHADVLRHGNPETLIPVHAYGKYEGFNIFSINGLAQIMPMVPKA